jgi:hypothetical protein
MKVKIYQEPAFNALSFTFYEERDGKKWIAKPMDIIMEEYKIGDDVQPTLRINSEFVPEFLKSLVNEINSEGIRADQDSVNEGQLIATKYHLEDLRELLKLKQ